MLPWKYQMTTIYGFRVDSSIEVLVWLQDSFELMIPWKYQCDSIIWLRVDSSMEQSTQMNQNLFPLHINFVQVSLCFQFESFYFAFTNRYGHVDVLTIFSQ
jgi:hypothetical protein